MKFFGDRYEVVHVVEVDSHIAMVSIKHNLILESCFI